MVPAKPYDYRKIRGDEAEDKAHNDLTALDVAAMLVRPFRVPLCAQNAGYPIDGGRDIILPIQCFAVDVKRKDDLREPFAVPSDLPRHYTGLLLGAADELRCQVEFAPDVAFWIWLCRDLSGGLVVPTDRLIDGTLYEVDGKPRTEYEGRRCLEAPREACIPYHEWLRQTASNERHMVQMRRERMNGYRRPEAPAPEEVTLPL